MPDIELTEADRRLLRLLQRDGRASTQDLADTAGLSSSPAWRRLKRLEDLAVIKGYVALLDQRKLGLGAVAYVQVSLTDHIIQCGRAQRLSQWHRMGLGKEITHQ